MTLRQRYETLRDNGYLRGQVIVPTVLIVAFVVVFLWGFHLTGQYDVSDPREAERTGTSTSSDFTQRLWATLAMFTGAYISLNSKYDPMPPTLFSLVGIFALSLTLLTAGSLLLLSRRARDFIRIVKPRANLVVIGNGVTAAALIKSSIEHRYRTILVTDSRESTAALATKPSIPIIASGAIDSALSTPSARRVIRAASHIVVATDSDGMNMRIYRSIYDTRKPRSPQASPSDDGSTQHRDVPKDLVVIHDPEYAEALHPKVVRNELPTREVTCPAENIAEHLCHLIVAAVTGGAGVACASVQVDEVDGGQYTESSPALAPTLKTWIKRLSWSMNFVEGRKSVSEDGSIVVNHVPDIFLAGDASSRPDRPVDLTIKVLTGASPTAVAAAALNDADASAVKIAVTNAHLIIQAGFLLHLDDAEPANVLRGRDWLRNGAPMTLHRQDGLPLLLVIDPDEVGLDTTLVTDDTGTQWARTFDLTHGLMFADGNYSVTGWQPGAPMGESTQAVVDHAVANRPSGKTVEKAARDARKKISNRYSSKAAVAHMLTLLSECGYELRACASRPDRPYKLRDDDAYIAEREHHHWLARTWDDSSSKRVVTESVASFSSSGSDKYCYQGLLKIEREGTDPDLRFAADYNRRIATETYPAIAASFGYQIVHTGAPRTATPDRLSCTTAQTCVCEQATSTGGSHQ